MSETTTLDEPDLTDLGSTEAQAPVVTAAVAPAAAGWRPGSSNGFGAPVSASAAKPTLTGSGDATAPAAGKPKGRKRGAETEELPYKPLPVPKPPKKLSPRQQAKADKELAEKNQRADDAARRINGTDDDIEVPKKPKFTMFKGKRATPYVIASTLKDLSSALESGDSEKRSVQALATQYANYDLGQAYERVLMLLNRGVTLEKAMADQTDNFPPVVCELIAAAKMPKDKQRNLRQAASIILEADNIKSKIKRSLFQPKFMLFMLVIFIIVAVQFLLPVISSMFTGLGAKVPPITLVAVSLGEVVKWVLGVGVVLWFLFRLMWVLFLKNNERLMAISDRFSLKAPLIGEISRFAVAARLCDVLGSCLAVGMSELEALKTASRACGNKAISDWIDEHHDRQFYGVVKFAAFAETELLPYTLHNRLESTQSITRRIELFQELARTFHDASREGLEQFAERIGPISTAVVVIAIIVVVLLLISPIISFVPTLLNSIGGLH